MRATSQKVQKLITFSSKLFDNAMARANCLGIPFAEYVRHVVIKDIEEGRYVDIDPSNEEKLDKLVGLK